MSRKRSVRLSTYGHSVALPVAVNENLDDRAALKRGLMNQVALIIIIKLRND